MIKKHWIKILLLIVLVILILLSYPFKKFQYFSDDRELNNESHKHSLVAHWSFNESNVIDQSGNSFHGRLQGNYSFTEEGIVGSALKVIGDINNKHTGGHVLLPEIPFEDYDSFTITMWVKEYSRSHPYGSSYIMFGDYPQGALMIMNHFKYDCEIKENQNLSYQFAVGSKIGNLGAKSDLDDALYYDYDVNNTGNWVFLSMKYENKHLYAYVNGKLVGSKEQELSISGKNAGIAIKYSGDSSQSRLSADIDEVKIYNYALKEEDIFLEYMANRPKTDLKNNSDLIAYWNFDDKNARDISGNGYHGELRGKSSFTDDGIQNSALHIEGVGMNTLDGGHVILPKIPFEDYKSFSLSMWVKEIGSSYDHGTSYIAFGDFTDGMLGIQNAFAHPTNIEENQHLSYYFSVGSKIKDYGAAKANEDAVYYDFNPDDRGRWVYLVMTYSKGILYAYINGVLVGSRKQELSIEGDNAGIGVLWWYSGQDHCTRLTADIDEIKIYARTLDQFEIVEEYKRLKK